MLASRMPRTGLLSAQAGRVLRRLLYGGVIVVLTGLAAALSIAAAPRLFGYGVLVVSGGSMGESMPNGSLVIARWGAAEQVEVGDVILVREEGAGPQEWPKVHRVVSLEENGGQVLVRTKGDANGAVDPDVYVLPDRVLTPAYTLPYLGHLVGFAKTSVGWALLVALPASVLCIVILRRIWAGGKGPLAKTETA